jgi:hypothetical protein
MKLACETGKQIVELEMMSINSVDNNDRQGSLEFGRKSNQGPKARFGTKRASRERLQSAGR